MKTIMFRVRIELELKQELESAVSEGKIKSMSDGVRTALTEFLQKEMPLLPNQGSNN